jgi:mono/diheme cytochrome c family protein/glucose/arabinose dehydrogenase
MKKTNKIILAVSAAAMFIYACKTGYIAQLPIERDASGKIKVQANASGEALSPEESMKHIYLPKGYHLQLVASEPMLSQPSVIAWDGNGVMYVAELNTYMLDEDGSNEFTKTCTVKRLEDTNSDGVMDKMTVFIDNLVLPRMLMCINHKLIVNETNTYNIFSYEDTDNDGKADKKVQVYKNDAVDNKNLEHQKTGLDWNIDNRIYVTVDQVRYEYKNDKLVPDTLVEPPRGQWGLTHDNYGRLFFSIAGSELPASNFQQNPHFGSFDLNDQFDAEFQKVWPIVATPDVQGGLFRLRLTDSTLNHFTSCNGQSIYRGDKLPMDARGDLFICEPVGRLIRRAKVNTVDGKTTLVNAYNEQEFIASTDLNFRPVNTATGPDGSLYIVDMYHGIIQESNWTRKGSFLRPKILNKGLQKVIGRGRIYRVVYDGIKPDNKKPNMLNETPTQLVAHLNSTNGWTRDNAQRLLVLNNDKSAVQALKTMAATSTNQLARIHALWTLNGMGDLNAQLLGDAIKSPDAQIRKAAVWMAEDLEKKNPQVLDMLLSLKNDPSADVRYQLGLTLRFNKAAKAQSALADMIKANPTNILALSDKDYHDKANRRAEQAKTQSLLAAADRALVERGQAIFKELCATCHGGDAKGVSIGGTAQPAPALANNADVSSQAPDKLIRILLHGLNGPVNGKTYPDIMPALGANTDNYIASVLSYIRGNFGNNASVVRDAEVARIREITEGRKTNWTTAELDTVRIQRRGGFGGPGAGGGRPPQGAGAAGTPPRP